jgi:hypothetical protein
LRIFVLKENLLLHLHCHIAYGVSDCICRAKHCLTHQKFAMNIVEQVLYLVLCLNLVLCSIHRCNLSLRCQAFQVVLISV